MALRIYRFNTLHSVEHQEIVSSILADLFDGFEQREDALDAYSTTDIAVQNIMNRLIELPFIVDPPEILALNENTNWNKEAEARFQPIIIGNACGVRSDFHEPLNTEFEIIINPKMSFGTGHHETTSMMIENMLQIDFKHKNVLDFGCGTSILAILASKLGASNILAIDNDPWCIENSKENISLNHCSNIDIRLGAEPPISNEYEIILANINRNTIIQYLNVLFNRLTKNGVLFVSGVLITDENLIIIESQKVGFLAHKISRKGKWISIILKK